MGSKLNELADTLCPMDIETPRPFRLRLPSPVIELTLAGRFDPFAGWNVSRKDAIDVLSGLLNMRTYCGFGESTRSQAFAGVGCCLSPPRPAESDSLAVTRLRSAGFMPIFPRFEIS